MNFCAKVCFVGPEGSGKTQLCHRIRGGDTMDYNLFPKTNGVRYSEIQRTIHNRNITLSLWDIGSSSNSHLECYIKSSDIVILTFPVEHIEKLEELDNLIYMISKYSSCPLITVVGHYRYFNDQQISIPMDNVATGFQFATSHGYPYMLVVDQEQLSIDSITLAILEQIETNYLEPK
ncbi:hypothetical protein TVAG_464430 [Trichomonas vaginalis G3]|uniref:Small GTP-binding protein n=1 Tax=Trichomonas vaginalis (strain ATCC PRA-98 / G3) TaxID=412133 RepID=A2EEI8_TRIV3|nr:P-loop containing nucleoside triphosphate hydrolases family [Trichomonas vaginalis G3]EAY08895.1 hypothetical protein TVAG_464430 [Trichomonas vaginalis G3]KAI5494372.1 P-loop containing nucleoside triphosphate hydrolases family [Trichomonas vaginalis G3]|eukprot:XP_001321118.1 hypothetical protein [Trichomonas vaginalis G3]